VEGLHVGAEGGMQGDARAARGLAAEAVECTLRETHNERPRHMQEEEGERGGAGGVGSGLLEEHEEHEEWECEADSAHATAEVDFVKRPCAIRFALCDMRCKKDCSADF